MTTLDDQALDLLFREARTPRKFHSDAIPEETLHALHDLMKFGATSANCWPLRTLFVRSDEAKKRLAEVAMGGNRERILTAAVTAILAYDLDFYQRMDVLWPHDDSMPRMFANNAEFADISAFRNGTLQAAYLMIAARALGLDCGPMSGFDSDACDREFFSDGRTRSNFLCVLGRGSKDGLHPRLPRPAFNEVCTIL